MPDFLATVARATPILTDGGIETRLLFEARLPLDPHVGAAAMLDDPRGRPLLRRIYASYVEAARAPGLPVVLGTPTYAKKRAFPCRW